MANTPENRAGKGTHIEGWYGAILLSHLLTKDPVWFLDNAIPQKVKFQNLPESTVDDAAVEATRGSESITARIHGRLSPGFNNATRDLFKTIIEEYIKHEPEARKNTLVFVLTCNTRSSWAFDVKNLIELARRADSESQFEENIAKQKWSQKSVVEPWEKFKELVKDASTTLKNSPSAFDLIRTLQIDLNSWEQYNVTETNAKARLDRYSNEDPRRKTIDVSLLAKLAVRSAVSGGRFTLTKLENDLIAEGLLPPRSTVTATPQSRSLTPSTTDSPQTAASSSDVLKTPLAKMLANQQGLDTKDKTDAAEIVRIDGEVRSFASWVSKLKGQEQFVLAAFFDAAQVDSTSVQLFASTDELESSLNYGITGVEYRGFRSSMVKRGGLIVDDDENTSVAEHYREGAFILHDFIVASSNPRETATSILTYRNWDLVFGPRNGQFGRHF